MRILRQVSGRVRTGWRLLAFLVALTGVMAIVNVAWRLLRLPPQRIDGIEQPWSMLGLAALALLSTAGLIHLMLRRFERRGLATLGLPLSGSWLGGLGTGLALGILPVGSVVATLALAGRASISRSAAAVAAPAEFAAAVLALTALSTLEELLWRGYGLQLLVEGLGRWPAVLLTATTWGLAHGFNPGANPLGLINTIAGGVLLAWLVLRTRSLWIAIGAHVGWNVSAAHLFGLTVSGQDSGASLMTTVLAGPDWITGGAYGFEAGLPAGLLELAILGVALTVAARLPGHPELRRFFLPSSASRGTGASGR